MRRPHLSDGFLSLQLAPGGGRPAALIGVLADIFLASTRHGRLDLIRFEELTQHLLGEVDLEARRKFAASVADRADLPRSVLLRLAFDDPEVAVPVLLRSPALTAADLVEVARTGEAQRTAVKARRIDPADGGVVILPEPDRPAEPVPAETVPAAIPAATAKATSKKPIVRPTVAAPAAKAAAPARPAVSLQLETPQKPRLKFELKPVAAPAAGPVAAPPAKPVAANAPTAPRAPKPVAQPAASSARPKTKLLEQRFLAADPDEREAIVAELTREGWAPDLMTASAALQRFQPNVGPELTDLAAAGREDELTSRLAGALRISGPLARRILEDRSGEAMIVAIRSLGISESSASEFIVARRVGAASGHSDLLALLKFYRRLSKTIADRLVTGWIAAEAGEAAAPDTGRRREGGARAEGHGAADAGRAPAAADVTKSSARQG
ncbi:MAG TPA: hypothetical protein PLG99_08455 [Kaistiaceae bacterium]|nr:hypothetical protein [Kaistiaceae bacterium]